MNKPFEPPLAAADAAEARARWERDYAQSIGNDSATENVSGIAVQPIYGPADWPAYGEPDPLGWPGQPDYTRGIYATMHRGRAWTQRQLIGLGTPADYNERLRALMARGATAVSLIPCNSVYRGYDMDSVEPELLGTCGVVVDNAEHMDRCLDGVDLNRISCALNDPSPFTLLAFMLVTAERRGVPWVERHGTSNQSDYLSHHVANHMFYRLSLPGRAGAAGPHRLLQREGAALEPDVGGRPAHATGGRDTGRGDGIHPLDRGAGRRGLHRPRHGPRPVPAALHLLLRHLAQLLRGSRQVPRRPADLGPSRSRAARREAAAAWRFKFHAQTSGVDLTRQQPLNNVARVAIQAMAGIFGGLQSLHTDAYDEAFQVPSEAGARIAVATQNILREEAHLTDVIDPLGGSFYVESLTDAMEAKILAIMKAVEDAGGMYKAVESGSCSA
jgi:methylmalonyl-CoA mutase N-terminal domain/subunit